MGYVLDPTQSSVVVSSKFFDYSYTNSGASLFAIFWPSKSSKISIDDNSTLSPDILVFLDDVHNFDPATSSLWELIETQDPFISASKVFWGDSHTGLEIYWTPDQKYSTQQELEAAINDLVNRNENGFLDRVVAYENGKQLFEVSFTNNQVQLDIGELSVSLVGQEIKGFQDFIDYSNAITSYGSLLDDALNGLDLDAQLKQETLSVIAQYNLDQVAISFQDEIVLQVTDSISGSSIKVGNSEFHINDKTSQVFESFLELAELSSTIEALTDPATSSLWELIETQDPFISASKVFWGDSHTGLEIYWTPDQKYSTQQELEAAINDLVNRNENGFLDRVVAYENGKQLFEVSFTNNQVQLDIGELSVSLVGQEIKGFQDFIDYSNAITSYGSLLDDALNGLDLDAQLKQETLSVIAQYNLDQVAISFQDEIVLQVTDSISGSSIKVGNSEFHINDKTSQVFESFLELAELSSTIEALTDPAGIGDSENTNSARSDLVSRLAQYALYGSGDRLESNVNLLGATIRLEGELAETDYGVLFNALLDLATADLSKDSFFQSDLAALLDFNIIEVLDDQGSTVISVYKPPSLASHTLVDVIVIQGSTGADKLVYPAFTENVLSRVVDLDSGDDVVQLVSYYELDSLLQKVDYTNQWGFSAPEYSFGEYNSAAYFTSPVTAESIPVDIFGGDGFDEIQLYESDSDFYRQTGFYFFDSVSSLVIDFSEGKITASNQQGADGVSVDLLIYNISFTDIERISFETRQTVSAFGDGNSNELGFLSHTAPWPRDLYFDGGDGQDSLVIYRDVNVDPLVNLEELMNSLSVTKLAENEFEFVSSDASSVMHLKNVELVKIISPDGDTQTVSVSDFAGDTRPLRDWDGLGSFTYHWFKDGVEVGNSDHFDIHNEDVGSLISASVNYIDGAGNAESITYSFDTAVEAYDRGDVDSYITTTLHLADQTETQLNHGSVKIATETNTLDARNYYWGTDLFKSSLDLNDEFTLKVVTDVSGCIDISDVIAQLKHIVGLSEQSGLNAVAADVNQDGEIGISDVIQNLKTIVGLRSSDSAIVCDSQGKDVFTIDDLSPNLYVIVPGDVDLSWTALDLI